LFAPQRGGVQVLKVCVDKGRGKKIQGGHTMVKESGGMKKVEESRGELRMRGVG
jgi:hypothetical protein